MHWPIHGNHSWTSFVPQEYSFLSSEYPVIISIENHCDFQNQRKMADVFGSKRELCKDNDLPNGRLPSPEQLKGKIILKGTYSEV